MAGPAAEDPFKPMKSGLFPRLFSIYARLIHKLFPAGRSPNRGRP